MIDTQSIAEDPDSLKEPEFIPELTDLQDTLLNQPKPQEQAEEEGGDDEDSSNAQGNQKGSKKTPEQLRNRLERIDDFLGQRFIRTIEEDKIDFEHLAVLHPDIIDEAEEMSDEWVLAKAEQFEKEAAELEDKLKSGKMTLKERAEYDKYVPFSL